MSACGRAALLAAALGLAACAREHDSDPAVQVLHARLTLSAAQDRVEGPGGIAGESRTTRRVAVSLAIAAPVRGARPGQPWVLTADATRAATVAGQAALHDEQHWYNWEAASSSSIALDGNWPDGAPAAAASGADRPAVRVEVEALVPAEPQRGLVATLVADLPLRGQAVGSGFQYGEKQAFVPHSPWPDCALAAKSASCRLALTFSSQPAPGPVAAASAASAGDGTAAPAPAWSRAIDGLQVTWNRDGHFVARADRLPDADSPYELHLVLWTSAPGDATPPPELAR